MTSQIETIDKTFVNLIKMQFRINNLFSICYETVARKQHVLYIGGVDEYSLQYDEFLATKKIVDSFSEGDYSTNFDSFKQIYTDIMYNSLLHLKAWPNNLPLPCENLRKTCRNSS